MLAEKQKLQHIEGIRGLAAIIVVLHHYTLAFYPALNFGDISQAHIGNGSLELLMANTPINLIYNGGFAVCIFFILSGYVLSNSYHQTNNPKILIQYAIKRYFRLLVPVSASIIIAYVFIKIGFMHNSNLGAVTKTNDWLSTAFDHDRGILAVIKNIFVDVFFFKDNQYNPVLWTMTYELIGSFLIFSFLLLIHPFKYKMSLFIGLILVLFFTDNNFYAAFILGVVLNKYVMQQQAEDNVMVIPKWLLVLILFVGIYFCSYPLAIDVNHTIYGFITFSFLLNYEFYHVLGSFIVMFVILHSEKLKTILSGKTMRYIGKISFSFYLLHFIILCSFSCYLFSLFYSKCHYNLAVLLACLCSLPLIGISAMFYYQCFDKSGIKLSEKVLRLFIKTEKP
jgi:peptidoglycan/LPS O-acetylase OafA/YrhL